MARKSTSNSAATAVADHEDPVIIFEDADEFMQGRSAAPMEEVHTKVKAAHEELLQLKLRQEEIERTKVELEIISERQTRFANGKRDVLEKLNRSVVSIERELYATQKLVEELTSTHDSYARHIEVVKSLLPEKWQRSQVAEELERALAAIDDAEDDYVKSIRRLQSLRPEQVKAEGSDLQAAPQPVPVGIPQESMQELIRRGLGLSLPLIGGLAVLMLWAKLLF